MKGSNVTLNFVRCAENSAQILSHSSWIDFPCYEALGDFLCHLEFLEFFLVGFFSNEGYEVVSRGLEFRVSFCAGD